VARAAETDALLSQLRAEVADARAVAAGAEERARRAEALLDRAQAELRSERDRHDTSLSELRDQLAQLLARRPVVRAAKRPPAGKGSAPATDRETGS
jgi:predicted metal-dependent hydrolase